MIPGGPDIRSDALQEAVAILRRRAVTVGIEHGDYAAKFVIDDASIVASLDGDTPTPTLSEDAIRADERARLIHHLQTRWHWSGKHILDDLQAHDWDLPA